MSGNLPREITFDQVQVGDTIRSEWTNFGVRETREGAVAKRNGQRAFASESGVLACVFRSDMTITLLDRP